jgi:two-component system chemotaxis sensor kinase CheA
MWANLLEGARSVLLFPFSSLLEFFPRMVRDLSREQGKETELFVKGDDIEVDRRVLEKLKDPLIHMIRNGVGHGVEKPEDRARKGKPRKGRIGIEIARLEGGHVEIAVSDDGVGIDPVMVKESAVRAGAATRTDADAMSERDAVQLIFRSEVTTSEKVDGLSGRGLGLAIALDNVRKIGGDIAVESAPSIGTTFRIRVPVNLASFRGVIMRAGDRLFAVPTSAMRRVVRVDASKLQTAGNREMVEVDGEAIPLFPLAATLGLEPLRKERGAFIVAVVLEANGNAAAFDVDEVIGEQEVLVKNLGRHLARLRLVSGATILGSGHVVPILNVPDLMRAARESAPPPLGETGDMKDAREAKKSILVVEDSITSRMLLKNILESAGYRVETSVDGRDAFAKLKISAYDLVVSDVDMPRMNGFELTARIRSDEAVSDTPVVLVTALGSREDRERGIDVGANAYILKSSFDQGDLLEVVRRLA